MKNLLYAPLFVAAFLIFSPKPVSADEMSINLMARTIWGEARGEGLEGMEAVASVIMNRYRVSQSRKWHWWGMSIPEICLFDKQFSAWNMGNINRAKMEMVTTDDLEFYYALQIAEDAYNGELEDDTRGATHFHTVDIEKKPSWAKPEWRTAVIGKHVFYKPVYKTRRH